MKTCRLCLRVSEKMYRIRNVDHKVFIENILKIYDFNNVVSEAHCVCYVCIALLSKTYNFTRMVVNAQKVLCNLLQTNVQLTVPVFMSIDRVKTGLNLISLSSVANTSNSYFGNQENSNIYTNDSINNNPTTNNVKVDETETTEFYQQTENVQAMHSNITDYTTKHNFFSIGNNICIDKNAVIPLSDKYLEENVMQRNSDPLNVNLKTHEQIITLDKQLKASEVAESVKMKRISISHDQENKHICKSNSSSDIEKETYISDDDYQPDSTSHSEDSDFDSYDDEGNRVAKPIDDRIFPRQCEQCNYEVVSKADHHYHYMSMHANVKYPYGIVKDVACSFCGKLQTRKRISSHEKRHFKRKVECTLCSKVFDNAHRLRRHITNVHTTKLLTCDYCSKTFKTRTDITRHIRTHTGEKPFKCHICGAGFAHSGNVKIHIRSAHQNIKYVPKNRKQSVSKIKSNLKIVSEDQKIIVMTSRTIKRFGKNTKSPQKNTVMELADGKYNQKRNKNTQNHSQRKRKNNSNVRKRKKGGNTANTNYDATSETKKLKTTKDSIAKTAQHTNEEIDSDEENLAQKKMIWKTCLFQNSSHC